MWPPEWRTLRTHWVTPRGDTRYWVPSRLSRLTGVWWRSPLMRPRCSSTREPQTLTPRRVSPAIDVLKTWAVNQPGRS